MFTLHILLHLLSFILKESIILSDIIKAIYKNYERDFNILAKSNFMLFNNIKSQYDVKMLIIIDFCAMNIDQIRSLNDTNGILTVIHRRTKIQLILLLNFELKSVRIMSL